MTNKTLLLPELTKGQINVGLIMKDGMPDYWLVVLPNIAVSAAHDVQIKWAESLNADLPNKIEGRLIRANSPKVFDADWWWLKDEYASDSIYGWYQGINGDQDYDPKDIELPARAVIRIPVKYE